MRIFSLAILVIVLNSTVAWLTNLPQDVGADVPNGKLNSLSFAPYHEGQSPLDEIFPSVEQIDADLQLMAQKTHTIRTYASAEGNMPAIPALAKKHGLQMIQGAWLGSTKADTRREVDSLIQAANQYPDVIKRVIVGNEVLLRGELDVDEIISYIREVKQAIKQPVSYADVWSMYMKNPQLIKEVDFITIHILPYWEDEPISVDDAPGHIERIYKHVRQEADSIAPGKAILIGESGWPSHGRQRGWSLPSVVNEAKFIRSLIKVANDNGFDCNIVEAINQSWKSELEGVVGANWGLYTIDRKEVFPLTGKVYENPEWFKGLLAATLLMLLLVGVFRQPLAKLANTQLVIFLVLSQVFCSLLITQINDLWYVSFFTWQRLQTLFIISFNVVIGAYMLQRAYDQLSQKTANRQLGLRLYSLYFIVVAFAVLKSLALALDGRYLSFPSIATYIPVLGIAVLMLMQYFSAYRSIELNAVFGLVSNHNPWHKRAAILLTFMAIDLVIAEALGFFISRDFIQSYPNELERLRWSLIYTFSNGQLLEWLFYLLVLALPLWQEGQRKAPQLRLNEN
ncbi:MAG: exo-beta-1,3-glucanase [Methylococcales bacterium]